MFILFIIAIGIADILLNTIKELYPVSSGKSILITTVREEIVRFAILYYFCVNQKIKTQFALAFLLGLFHAQLENIIFITTFLDSSVLPQIIQRDPLMNESILYFGGVTVAYLSRIVFHIMISFGYVVVLVKRIYYIPPLILIMHGAYNYGITEFPDENAYIIYRLTFNLLGVLLVTIPLYLIIFGRNIKFPIRLLRRIFKKSSVSHTKLENSHAKP